MPVAPTFVVETRAFAVENGEDDETNPGRFGKAFSAWIAEEFRKLDQPVEDVVPEDWGWCVVLQRKPYSLWIGCGNETGSTEVWRAFVVAESGFLKRLFGSANTQPGIERATKQLRRILEKTPGLTRFATE